MGKFDKTKLCGPVEYRPMESRAWDARYVLARGSMSTRRHVQIRSWRGRAAAILPFVKPLKLF